VPPAPWLLALGLVVALLVLVPARRLQLAGIASGWIAGYALLLWGLGMLLAIRPIASRILVPLLVILYLAPLVAAPERVGRFLTRGGGRTPRRRDGPGADGRDVKDVTPPPDDQRP
jgi:hypothetical protein